MSGERLDFYDEQERKLGTATRKEIHEKGLWHRTFQCWIVSRNPELSLLFQKRHRNKDVFPGKLDKSAAGHLLAGETPIDGLRELEEELGLCPDARDLHFCGMTRVESRTDEWWDREFCYMYLYISDQPIEAYRIQTSEVSGLYRVTVKQYEQLARGRRKTVTAAGADWDEHNQCWKATKWTPKAEDFTPQNEAYYDKLFRSIQRLQDRV